MVAHQFNPRATMYRGIAMRSRLEAHAAAYFDRCGDQWEYEPHAFADETGQYLPDFVLAGAEAHRPIYVEVKPMVAARSQWRPHLCPQLQRMEVIWSSNPDAILFLGQFAQEGPAVWFTAAGPGREWRCWPPGSVDGDLDPLSLDDLTGLYLGCPDPDQRCGGEREDG